MLHVTEAHYISDFCVQLSFDDGTTGIANLRDVLNGPVFEPLKKKEYFKQFRFDPLLGTIVWPNGVDLAPEFLQGLVE